MMNEDSVVASQNRVGIWVAAPAEELWNMDGLLGSSGGSIVVHYVGRSAEYMQPQVEVIVEGVTGFGKEDGCLCSYT